MPPEAPAVALAGALLVWMAAENVRTTRLRDVLTLRGAAAVAVVLAIGCAVAGDFAPLGGGVAGAAMLFALGLGCAVAAPAWVGFGTVKACLVLGLAAGSLGADAWTFAALALPLATLAVLAVCYLRGARTAPTGPALVAAYAAALLATV